MDAKQKQDDGEYCEQGGLLLKASTVMGRLRELGDAERVKILQRFFKTGPGEYAAGDIFWGLRVPDIRKLAKECEPLPLPETIQLLKSPIHEARFLALLLLIQAYRRGDDSRQAKIYALYLGESRHINNWDLVDVSAEHIVGAYLRERSRLPLYTLARSSLLWERRIAVMATFHYIKQGEFAETLNLADLLLNDAEDLIHKATGWMLREIGKRDRSAEEAFLKTRYCNMPRTMLRYAIEKFPEPLRQSYLKGTI